MKRQNQLFIVISLIGIILISNIFLFYKLSSDFNDKLQNAVLGFEQKLQDQNRDIKEMGLSLESKVFGTIEEFKSESIEKFNTLSKDMERIQDDSSLKISELEKRIISDKVTDFSETIKNTIGSVVSVLTPYGQGSGVFIRDDGYIVTNYHVIRYSKNIKVYTYDKTVYSAELIGYNSVADIAVIKINSTDYKGLNFGDPNEVVLGENVIALGNPGGLDFTVTQGIVSAVHREGNNGMRYVQIDVPINPGNSGGPLLNIRGEIIGINNFKIGGYESIGFAIEADIVEDASDKIIEMYEESTIQ